ncbi:hypothetical protein AB0E78_39405 [Streptomyces sp. NPDC032198]|uniref:hypothetical protein n=1 Tax=Streptomyces sp. NPDC032198 TaxID=3155127 RepID=UPI0033C47708
MNRPHSRTSRRPRMRFDGWIAGMGTAGGTRIVLGHWQRTPFGPFSDVMVEDADGERLLLAPSQETADFISGTYTFDAVRVVPVEVDVRDDTWTVTADPLSLCFTVGRRGWLGLALCAVPDGIARRPAWSALTDWPARVLMSGVQTRGSAGGGRTEWYGALDLHPLRTVSASFDGADLGPIAPVTPPVRFGFGSAPRTPSLTRITTTVALSPERP